MQADTTKDLGRLDLGGPVAEEGNTSESTRSIESSDKQQSIHLPDSLVSSDISSIYPRWSSILPHIIKGLLFPPIAQLFRRLYNKYATLAYLRYGIRYAFANVATTHRDHPSLPFYKLRLAQDLKSRYKISGDTINLTLALLLQRTALNTLPVTHPDMNWQRQEFHESVTMRYEKYGNLSDLDILLQLEETALAQLSPNSSNALWWKSTRSSTYRSRYARTGNVADLDLQMDWSISAMDSVDLGSLDSSFLRRASMLSSAYVTRFEHYHIMDDLVLGLFWGHHSLRDGPYIDPTNYSIRCHVLASAYDSRYIVLRLLSDSDKALDLTKQTLQMIPYSHSVSLKARHNLGTRYLNRGQFLRSQQDLDLALEWFSSALERFPKTSAEAAICAGNSATAYLSRYNLHHSRLEDLESAVDLGTRCVQSLGDSHLKSATFQEKLSNIHFQRYLRHRNKQDIDTAIHWCKSSLHLTRPNTKQWLERKNLLGSLYLSLYRHTKVADHLDQALALQTEVVALSPQDDEEIAEFYADLATAYSAVYDLRGGMENRDAIIRWNTAAVQIAKPGNPRLKVFKYQLGVEYLNRYNRLRNEEDLDSALKYISEAVALSPAEDPMRASYYGVLASIYSGRHSLSHTAEDEKETLLNYRKAAESLNSNPSHVWDSIDRWARFAERNQQAQDCIDAYNAAFRILPELFWLGSDIKSRHEALIAFGINAVTTKAVAGCIHFQHLSLAVEFLEQSLGMTFQQLLGLQSDLGDLEEKFPAYASMLESLSTKIRGLTLLASTQTNGMANDSSESNTQSKLVIERATLLKTIRELPGFESFLLPIPFEKLCTAADQGPIIMLNSNQRRHYCDALILLPGGSITHVVLQYVSIDDVIKQVEVLKRALKAYGIQTRGTEDELSRAGRVRPSHKSNGKEVAFQPLLDWLWTNVVSRIFEILKDKGILYGRIWWCPTGPFTHLPLHAAGPPSDYIQSYTSNLGSLIRARSLPSATDRRITAIGLSDFGQGGFAPLPSVLSEISSIKTAVGTENVTTLINNEATLPNTIAALSKASWLHLACHGEQGNTQDPLKSRIILFNHDNLDLQTIIATSTPSAEFVFLSACETATGDTDMSNESLHLAGGMLFAGFKAAIGTLWSINDADGPVVAQSVYSRLFAEGHLPTASQTAEALHFAIREMRMRGAPPHRWAPFIHIGI